jgi:hypothetical protein
VSARFLHGVDTTANDDRGRGELRGADSRSAFWQRRYGPDVPVSATRRRQRHGDHDLFESQSDSFTNADAVHPSGNDWAVLEARRRESSPGVLRPSVKTDRILVRVGPVEPERLREEDRHLTPRQRRVGTVVAAAASRRDSRRHQRLDVLEARIGGRDIRESR